MNRRSRLGRRIHGLLLVGLGLGAQRAAAAQDARVTVFAAASLKDAFTEAGSILARRRPRLAVRFNFAGSQQLVFQLEQGASADVFASADERWMRRAGETGLITGPARLFAHNRLIVIAPAANPGRVTDLRDLGRPGLRLVLGAEAVPIGRYSREALARLAQAPGFDPGFAARALANVASEEEDVKGVVAKVQLGEADAGIVYVSDVTGSARRALRILDIPPAYNRIAAYPIAVLAAARQPGAARAFVDFILSPEGQAVLGRHGLSPGDAP